MNYTAIIKQDGDWWIGWVEEVPGVNAQEKTKPELMASLRQVLLEALDFNREEARQSAESDPDPGADAAWEAEITQRMTRFDAGDSPTVPASAVFPGCAKSRIHDLATK